MTFYLWYDQVKKRYVTGNSKEFQVCPEEVLYTFDSAQLSACEKSPVISIESGNT